MARTITLEDDEALVLFEWLSREIEERKGAGLGPAFVSPAEFWALNALHCLLERADVAPVRLDYAEAVAAARARLDPAETGIEIACLGAESPAMAGGG
jgi:hypothetical protein